jgi:iron-sulfur cluster assembly accessory protein
MGLTVTEAAASELQGIITTQAQSDEGLRIIAGAGGCACSGTRFGMGFDTARDGDTVIEVSGIRFLFDADTAPQIEDAKIDFVDDVMQRGFSIEAPNASTGGGSCGCGGH